MRRLLLIVDPQVDFISGTLPVPGAEDAMNRLSEYISHNNGIYIHKILTADHHPYDHFSFADYGGEWPRHCVHDTVGAAIWQPLFDSVYRSEGDVTILYKGQSPDSEEYSIFKNDPSASEIDRIIKKLGIEKIDICGLAGDVCVKDTLADGIRLYGEDMFNVLKEYSPTIQPE